MVFGGSRAFRSFGQGLLGRLKLVHRGLPLMEVARDFLLAHRTLAMILNRFSVVHNGLAIINDGLLEFLQGLLRRSLSIRDAGLREKPGRYRGSRSFPSLTGRLRGPQR